MKAAVLPRFDQALSIDEIPMPTPEHGQVPVKAETSGLCRTDIHAAHLR